MVKHIILALVLSFTSMAFAHHTEQFYQVGKKEIVVSPFFKYTMGSGGLDPDIMNLGSLIEYGAMDKVSIGAELGYSSVSAGSNSSGLDRVGLFAKGHQTVGLNWGAQLKINTDDGSGSSVQPGAMTYGGYIGYELEGDKGFRISYLTSGSDSSNNQIPSEIAVSGYYEHDWEKIHLGYSVGFGILSKSVISDVKIDNAMNLLKLKVYPVWKVPGAEVIGGLGYDFKVSGDANSSASQIKLEAFYRRAL